MKQEPKRNEWILDGNFQNLIHFEKQGTAPQNAIPTLIIIYPDLYAYFIQKATTYHFLTTNSMVEVLSMTSVL